MLKENLHSIFVFRLQMVGIDILETFQAFTSKGTIKKYTIKYRILITIFLKLGQINNFSSEFNFLIEDIEVQPITIKQLSEKITFFDKNELSSNVNEIHSSNNITLTK